MTPRESPARRRILDAAAEMFYARGIRGVGMDTIIAASGVAKATLYAHFPTKDDLVLAYLARADSAWQGKLRAAGRGNLSDLSMNNHSRKGVHADLGRIADA